MKEVGGTQLVAALNPAAGTFLAAPRLARHFSTFVVPPPSAAALRAVYAGLLLQHVAAALPSTAADRLATAVVDATADVVARAAAAFPPTQAAPHYSFTPRDVGAVVAGVLAAPVSIMADPAAAARLWVHEVRRCAADRAACAADAARFDEFVATALRKHMPDVDAGFLTSSPPVFTRLLAPAVDLDGEGGPPAVCEARSLDAVGDALAERAAPPDFVMFPDAADHASRLAAVLARPGGHAVLVGVGGWGKQSLVGMAARCMGVDVVSPAPSPAFGVAEFKALLTTVYTKVSFWGAARARGLAAGAGAGGAARSAHGTPSCSTTRARRSRPVHATPGSPCC